MSGICWKVKCGDTLASIALEVGHRLSATGTHWRSGGEDVGWPEAPGLVVVEQWEPLSTWGSR